MKLLIVEDEVNIINLILSQLDREALGISETLTAYQGERGLEICRNLRPDLILTDIEMPVMDGITMIEKLQEIPDYRPEIIILSCHADFSYAQKALRFGAAEYLLKPFYPEELQAVLLKAVFRREKTIREKTDEAQKGELLQRNHNQTLRVFAQDLISGTSFRDLQDIEQAIRKQGIEDFDPRSLMRLVCFAVNEETLGSFDLQPAERAFILENMVREVVYGSEQQGGFFCSCYRRPFYILTGFSTEKAIGKEELQKRCTRLISETERYMRMDVISVISEPVRADGFPKAFRRIEEALPEIAGSLRAPVFLDSKTEPEQIVLQDIDTAFIFRCIDERKPNDLIISMKRYLDNCGPEISLLMLREIRQRISSAFYQYFSENRLDTGSLISGSEERKLYENAGYSTVHMIKYLNYLYDSALKRLEAEKSKDTQAERVRQYIREHYREDIDRGSIASHIRLAPNYLSHLFHKEFGCSIREYINECRIHEAKRLLVNTNQTVTEIALSTGFNNIPYFSTVFKKYTDMTPAEYRTAVEKGEKS